MQLNEEENRLIVEEAKRHVTTMVLLLGDFVESIESGDAERAARTQKKAREFLTEIGFFTRFG